MAERLIPNVVVIPNAVVLASASRSRASLLRQAGVPVIQDPAAVDEQTIKESLKAEGALAADVATALALLKAERVSRRHPNCLVVGADQMLECEGDWFDKPAGVGGARDHLRHLRGRTHSLISAVVVARNGARIWDHVAVAKLTMRDFSDAFLDGYLEVSGEDVCLSVGAYQLEGRGAQLFDRIEGDYFTILGLPLIPLLGFLRDQGAIGS